MPPDCGCTVTSCLVLCRHDFPPWWTESSSCEPKEIPPSFISFGQVFCPRNEKVTRSYLQSDRQHKAAKVYFWDCSWRSTWYNAHNPSNLFTLFSHGPSGPALGSHQWNMTVDYHKQKTGSCRSSGPLLSQACTWWSCRFWFIHISFQTFYNFKRNAFPVILIVWLCYFNPVR